MLIRLKLMRRDIINGKVVKLKITRDITKLVFDQIRINGIKKKKEEYRTSCKIVLTTLTKLTKKKKKKKTLFFNTFYFT